MGLILSRGKLGHEHVHEQALSRVVLDLPMSFEHQYLSLYGWADLSIYSSSLMWGKIIHAIVLYAKSLEGAQITHGFDPF